jgi:hypothetical protein
MPLILEEQWIDTLGMDITTDTLYTVTVHYYDVLTYGGYKVNYPLDGDGGAERNSQADSYVADFVQNFKNVFEQEVNVWGLGPIREAPPSWDGDRIVHVVFSGWATRHPNEAIAMPLKGAPQDLGNHAIPAHPDSPDQEEILIYLNRYEAQHVATIASHEFFHTMQFNWNLHDPPYERQVDVTREGDNHFHEGQPAFAESVFDPDGIRYQYPGSYPYLEWAKQYLTDLLNKPYSELNVWKRASDEISGGYRFALYWRFLFEHYKDGTLAERMAIIKQASAERDPYYSETGASIHAPQLTHEVMNRAFAAIPGRYDAIQPDRRFDQSVADFALANYLLSDVITRPFTITDISRYDFPIYQEKDAYVQAKAYPEVSRNGYGSRPEPFHPPSLIINDQILSTYGMDFIEVDIDPFQDASRLHLQFESIPASPGTWFQVQVVTEYSVPGRTELVDVHLMNENWDYTWNEGSLDLPLQTAPPVYRNKLGIIGMAGRRPFRS